MASEFDIKINAKADIGSASKAVDELNKSLGITKDRERELAEMRKSFLTAAEAEVQVVKKLAEASKQLAATKEAERRAAQTAANPWASTGLSDQQKMLDVYRRTLDQVPPAQEQVRRSSANMGQAMLNTGRALQDLQGGIGGILNNIEGLAASFGLGAGVAGAATAAGVALYALGPHLLNLVNAILPLDEALGKVSAKLSQDAVEAGQQYMATVDNAGKQSRAFEAALQAEKIALDSVNESIDRQVKLLETRQRIQLMMEDAALAAQVEDIKAQKLSPQEEARQIAQAKLQSQDRKAGIEEAGRQAAMQGAQRQFANAVSYAGAMTQRSEEEQRKAEASDQFTSNLTEIARAQDEAARRRQAIAQEQAQSRAMGLPVSGKPDEELARFEFDIKRREQLNAGILSRYGGQVPRRLSPENLELLRNTAAAAQNNVRAQSGGLMDLFTQQQAARELATAQRTIATQGIAKDYTQGANPGVPVFSNPLTAADYMGRTGQIGLTPQMPGTVPFGPAGQFAGSPLEGGFTGGLGAPLGQLTAPITQAAQAIQGSPLDLSALGRPLEELGTSVLDLKDNLQRQLEEQAAKLNTLTQQVKNTR